MLRHLDMNHKFQKRFLPVLFTSLLMLGLLSFGNSDPAHATTSQNLNAGWLIESARNLILTSDPWADLGCVVETTGTPSDFTVYKSGRIDVVAVLERYPNSFRDIGAVSVEVYVDGDIYLRFDPSPYLSVAVPAFRTTRSIDRGEILSENDFEQVILDVREIPSDDIYESSDEIIGQAARMNIGDGRILTDGLLESPTLVFRGDTVLVVIPVGNMSVSLHGTSLDSGALGDEIRVRNPDSNAIITARVTGPSTAEVIV